MREEIRNLFTIFLVSILLFMSPNISLGQNKKKENAVKNNTADETHKRGRAFGLTGDFSGEIMAGVIGGIEGEIQEGIQYGIQHGTFESDEDDFIKEPKKIIEFYIDHLLIKATETIPYETATKIKTDNGKAVSYSYSSESFRETEIKIELTPLIIENKGIEINIRIFHGGEQIKEEKVFTKNLEPIVVELLENKDKQEKFADKIVPLIQTINPAIRYPYIIKELKFLNYMLFMNHELIERTIRMDLTVPSGSKDNPIFVGFFIEGKGMHVMSLSPFEGAEPIGVARDNVMKFRHKGDLFEFVSLRPIMPEGKWLVWVRINPFYDPMNDSLISDELSEELKLRRRENLKLRLQKSEPYVSFLFSGKDILERVFGKKKKTGDYPL